MRERRVIVGVAVAGIGEAVGRALERAGSADRGLEAALHPGQIKRLEVPEGRGGRIRDWEFRNRRGRRPS